MQRMHWQLHSRPHIKNRADIFVSAGKWVLAVPPAIDTTASMIGWPLEELEMKMKVRSIIVVPLLIARTCTHQTSPARDAAAATAR